MPFRQPPARHRIHHRRQLQQLHLEMIQRILLIVSRTPFRKWIVSIEQRLPQMTRRIKYPCQPDRPQRLHPVGILQDLRLRCLRRYPR